MNRQMEEVLKIAIYSISEFKTVINTMPQVNIIMNMVAQTDQRQLDKTNEKLFEGLSKLRGIDKNDENNQILNIKKENVFALPFAFDNQSQIADVKLHQPSQIFANEVDKLRQNIFRFMSQDKSSTMKLTLKSWFTNAARIWETINNYRDLDKYSTLDEKMQSMTLLEFVNANINEHFNNSNNENKLI
jgi:hypothetical protein